MLYILNHQNKRIKKEKDNISTVSELNLNAYNYLLQLIYIKK